MIPWTIAHQAPLSMEFPKQEYWSGLPFPSPGHLLNPGIKPGSPELQADSLPSQPTTTVPMIQYKDTDRIQAIVVFNSMRNKMSIFITKKLIHIILPSLVCELNGY